MGQSTTSAGLIGSRAQAVNGNGSTWTFLNPSAVSRATPQSRARAAASLPATRGPTSVVRDSM